MQEGGTLVNLFGWLVGSGPGAGMSLMFLAVGILGMVVGLGAYAFPAIRYVEDILPDYDKMTPRLAKTEGVA